ncbi:serine/threonine protein kinase [Nocardia neocaledoniensis NBRC 108232]|uniref:Serine/threonine protein kinase n=1 Tax=Nocardia neocaledoniensis TaxID=236511 RepID=A0A317NMK8_9NOCA|nr:serine/threonine-protein kinase [Nocardia neocaledoniensis]PWV76247.1 serine/threonine protein kinase [Nocardia neocaledoniensis]GEM31247.1 serine/threonine protein kinase [Nocardia neocaledoniensis NBRC 108232]
MQPLGTDDPRQIGAYRLLGVLGAGGMGKVYLGRTGGGRTVAVKVIRPDLLGDPELRARFRREVAAARRVGGAFTAPVLDADVDADPPWLATGFVAGLPLSDAVSRFGPFGEPALLALGHGLAEALVAIHGAGVVHRDLKPSNVLLAVDGPKVIDFGIARATEDTALTTTGKVIGSPGFMCPEQVSGEPLGPACDVFALGGVLAFAATGHGPFGTAELVQMLWRIMYEEPRIDALPERLRPLVASCLVKDPAARPAPAQVLTELTRLGDTGRTGWLPPALVEEIGTRAVRLLDLDTAPDGHPVDGGPAPASTGPASHAPPPGPTPDSTGPAWASTGGHPTAATGPGSVPSGSGPVRAGTQTGPGPTGPAWSPRGGSPSTGGGPATSATGPAPNSTGPAWASTGTGISGSGPSWAVVDPTVHRRPEGTAPGPHQPGRKPRGARRTRGLLVAAVLVVVVAVAAGAYLIGTQLRDPRAGVSLTIAPSNTEVRSPGTPPSTDSPGSPPTGDAAGTVPAAFVGTWKGRASDGLASFTIELTIGAGSVGEEVANSANTGTISGARCARAETLTEATAGRLTFRARLTGESGAGGCVDDGKSSTVTLRPDGTVDYSTPGLLGGAIAGVLSKG